MNISPSHAYFANRMSNPRILTNPEEFLGANWQTVLNFWHFIDKIDIYQWEILLDKRLRLLESLPYEGKQYANLSYNNHKFFNNLYGDNTRFPPGVRCSVRDAAFEIYAADEILQHGRTIKILPLFEF